MTCDIILKFKSRYEAEYQQTKYKLGSKGIHKSINQYHSSLFFSVWETIVLFSQKRYVNIIWVIKVIYK